MKIARAALRQLHMSQNSRELETEYTQMVHIRGFQGLRARAKVLRQDALGKLKQWEGGDNSLQKVDQNQIIQCRV